MPYGVYQRYLKAVKHWHIEQQKQQINGYRIAQADTKGVNDFFEILDKSLED